MRIREQLHTTIILICRHESIRGHRLTLLQVDLRLTHPGSSLTSPLAFTSLSLQFTSLQSLACRYVPHVIEPSIGVDRLFLALICSAYAEDEVDGEKRVLLKFHPSIAPIKVRWHL